MSDSCTNTCGQDMCGNWQKPGIQSCVDTSKCPMYPIPACCCNPDDYVGNVCGPTDTASDEAAKSQNNQQQAVCTPPYTSFNLRGVDDTPKSINTRFLKVSKPIYNNANRAQPMQCTADGPKPSSAGSRGRQASGSNGPANKGANSGAHSSGGDNAMGSRRKKSKRKKFSKTPSKKSSSKTRRRNSPKPLSLGGRRKKNRSIFRAKNSVNKPGKKILEKEGSEGSKSKSRSGSRKKSRGRSRVKGSTKGKSTTRSSGSSERKRKNGSSSEKKKSRGRSSRRTGRTKPRGPPTTPVAIDEKKRKSQMLAILEKFNKYILETGLGSEDNTAVNLLRGYSSEPDLKEPCEIRFPTKSTKKGVKPARQSNSLDDMIIDRRGYAHLINPYPYSDDDFKEFNISPNVWHKWHEYFELEHKRYSFYDELFAKKYVTDSMEVPGNCDDISYLVEADDKDYRSKIDYGRIVLKTKHVYTGNFVDWYFQGPGRYVWLDGSVYQGDFVNGVMHGEGTLLWPNGSIYEGQFRQGVRGGFGVYTTAQGYIYSGDWLQGFPHGKGKFWYDPVNNPGNFYEGELAKGFPDGFGTRHYKNGDRYVGYWVNGQREGQGTMFWREQKQMYKGQWMKGKPHGEGIQAWFRAKVQDEELSERVPDNTKKASQQSTFPYPAPLVSRHIFKGHWEKGERHGPGRLYDPNGSVYEGTWEMGIQVGEGILTDQAGEIVTALNCQSVEQTGFMDDMFDRPTCECLFARLLTALYKKLPLKMCENHRKDERELTKLCFDQMQVFRLLYQRVVDLGTMWSNYTLSAKLTHPCKPKPKCFHPTRDFTTDFGNNPSIFSKFSQMEPHGGTHLATRFGLWLFVKDFKKLGKDICLAKLDESWASMPSIGFQTIHSPFETVHFWQFIQCLIVLSFEVHFVVPFEKSRAKYKCKTNEKEGTEVLTSKLDEKIINKGPSRNSNPSQNGKKINPKAKVKKKTKAKAGRTLSPAAVISKKQAKEKAVLNVRLSDDDFIDIPKQDDGTVGRPPSELLHADEQTETDFEELQRQGSSEDDIYESFPTCEDSTCMTDIVNAFIHLELVPCFSRVAGKNLPVLPNSLPPIKDLFEMFKSIKNQDVILASDFMYSVLPHRVFPDNYRDVVFWKRTDDILSVDVDYDALLHHVRDMEIRSQMKNSIKASGAGSEITDLVRSAGETLINVEGQFSRPDLGVDINNNFETSDFSIENESSVEAVKYCGPPKAKRVAISIKELDEPVNDTPKKSKLYDEDGIPSIEFELLTPDSFQPTNDLPFDRAKLERPRSLRNLRADDVVGVIRYLYPGLCGQVTETNLQFQMLFCDWLWCMILCTQVSLEKEKVEDGRVKANYFQVSSNKNVIHAKNMDNINCCHSKKRNDEKFFQDHILSVFYKHQDLRRGEKWNCGSSASTNTYEAVQSCNVVSNDACAHLPNYVGNVCPK